MIAKLHKEVKMRKSLIFLLSSITLSNSVYAGVRESFYILTYPVNAYSESAAAGLLDGFFNKKLAQKYYQCDTDKYFPEEIDFEKVFIRKRPKNIKAEDVSKLVEFDKKSLGKIQKVLASYKDKDAPHGFDMIIAYKVSGGDIEFYAAGPDELIVRKSIIKNFNVENIATPLCQTIRKIGFSSYIAP
ncbi:hypothetical protein J9978_15640 [Chromobacterium violaceum]|uniref:hypothetical protein n=1 Tax=Chromobacterium violaceum TaxID=536 RepID=UPI001B32CD52|nr:hypothetical protein [Chromobacterium violaceum]MBP4050921.1 hypothetical protein [Chromobacterium violaceum]